jgi:hypothetical protein
MSALVRVLGVETLDPAAVVEQMLSSGEVPGLGRDPTERQHSTL